MESLQKAIDDIVASSKILIMCHVNPDADALSSAVALKKLIKLNTDTELNKQIDILFDAKEISETNSAIIKGVETNVKNCKKYDLIITVDCSNVSRLGKNRRLFFRCDNTLNIDHHETNKNFAVNNLVLKKASSTCEVLFLLSKSSNLHISDDVCKLLYAGIITDTNNMTQGTITVRTHKIITEMIERGLNIDAINEHFFKNNTKSKAYLLKSALDSLSFYVNDRIAFMKLTKQDLNECDATFEDTYGIVNQGIEIKGVDIAVLAIKQEDNSYYVSLRGKGEIAVSHIAENMGGGGHNQVAAFNYNGLLSDLKDELIRECKAEFALHLDSNSSDDLFS